MLNRVKNIFIAVLLVPVCAVWSQNDRQTKDTINTEVVNVVKPYSPKISDAFKVKEIPTFHNKFLQPNRPKRSITVIEEASV